MRPTMRDLGVRWMGHVSRIGQIPTYGVPAASGASVSGFNSLNRTRNKLKLYPGQAKPKPPPGPGSPPPAISTGRLSIPPSASAHSAPVPAALAGTVPGQPPRKRLKIDDDPFGAVGDYAGSFVVKTALGLSGGYDTNPGRTAVAKGSPFYVVAPEFLAVSDWERHALVADLRGSFTGYGNSFAPPPDGTISSVPTNIDRPDFTGHVDGRVDVTRDTRLLTQLRLRVATDNPGSPNIQAGLAKYPVYSTLGGTFGADQNFNRLQISGGGTIDRTVYTESKLTDGTSTTNDDRNFNQYGGVGRISYDLLPGLKPFGEIEGDSRVHDLPFDRNGYRRDSDRRLCQGRYLVRVLPASDRRNIARLCDAELRRSAPRSAAGPAGRVVSGLDRHPADHGAISFRHLDRRDHRARRLRRADAYLYL